MNKKIYSYSGGIGLSGIVTIVFIILRLLGIIDWSWTWVLSPLWIDFMLMSLIITGLTIYFKHENKKNKGSLGYKKEQIEVLKKNQQELEDALRLEIDYEQVKDTKDDKKLLRYLRKRRRVVNSMVKKIERIDD